jgi:hypothetical protein
MSIDKEQAVKLEEGRSLVVNFIEGRCCICGFSGGVIDEFRICLRCKGSQIVEVKVDTARVKING